VKPTLLVLAAGIGSRYGGLKQLDEVGPSGEVVLDYSVYDALRSGFGKVVFVIRHDIEEAFRQRVGGKYESRTDVYYAFQELNKIPAGHTVPDERAKPWGTAHAVMMTEDCIHEPFAVINADDFYGVNGFEVVGDHLSKQNATSSEYAMVGYTLRDTLSEYGHVARGICECDEHQKLMRVVERTKIVKQGDRAAFEQDGAFHTLSGDEIVSMNFWGLTPSVFEPMQEQFETFLRESIDNPKAEFYIPTVVDTMISNERASVRVLPTTASWYGITYRDDKPLLMKGIRKLVDAGIYPEKLWESPG
jgi:UTP-glucose-1-phosphate uridylyltransferase